MRKDVDDDDSGNDTAFVQYILEMVLTLPVVYSAPSAFKIPLVTDAAEAIGHVIRLTLCEALRYGILKGCLSHRGRNYGRSVVHVV